MIYEDLSFVLDRLGEEPIRDATSLRARLVPELKAVLDEGRAAA
jgi:hypothetical protein